MRTLFKIQECSDWEGKIKQYLIVSKIASRMSHTLSNSLCDIGFRSLSQEETVETGYSISSLFMRIGIIYFK